MTPPVELRPLKRGGGETFGQEGQSSDRLAAFRLPRSETPRAKAPEGDPRQAVRWPLVLVVAAAFWCVFFTIEHDTSAAGREFVEAREDIIADEYIDDAEKGNALRRVLLVAFGLGGVYGLIVARDRPWNLHPVGAALFIALWLWTIASISWSNDPDLSMRRVFAAGMVLVGSLGYARLLRANEVLAVSLLTFMAFIAASFLIDVAAGGRPWAKDYRFGGTIHPNIQAAYCGLACIAAYCQPARGWRLVMLRSAFVVAFILLVKTVSRTSVLAVLVGLLVSSAIRLPTRARGWAIWLTVCGGSALTILYSSLTDAQRAALSNTALLGRTEQASSLTGRVPLWEELAKCVARRPLQGYGYESFWVPEQIEAILKSQHWALQSAHNAYFEVVLQLGFVGLALAIGAVLVAFNRVQGAYSQTKAAGYAFAYGALGFAVVNGLLESHFAKLKYPSTMLLIIVLGALAFAPPREKVPKRSNPRMTLATGQPR